jgi:hypothetical protein
LAIATSVLGDTYMHFPRGSNNRLDEASRDRNNGNRLFDSQNNNRGGANAGTYGRPYYYVGSVLPVEWTNQHSCGEGNNVNCEVIIQYYCDNNSTRDGMTTTRIPDPDELTAQEIADQCIYGDCDNDYRFGRHESLESYRYCKYRSRNKGLWTSSQDMSGRDGAVYTRQNNNGNRRGYECPEERDYYPYWNPTPWIDLAILTNDHATRCPAYRLESQNVKARSYCKVSPQWIAAKKAERNVPEGEDYYRGFIPIEPQACADKGGVWTEVPAHNVPAPYCGPTPWTRDNQLGNMAGGMSITPNWNWTIPNWRLSESCVLRLRYNISTFETRNAGEWKSPSEVSVGDLNKTLNYVRTQLPAGLNTDDNDPLSFRYASKVDLWTRFRLSYSDVESNFDPNKFQQNQATRGYVLSNDPVVDIFGTDIIPATQPRLRLRLAVDTSQYSRTFQDRTHTFAIRPRPAILDAADLQIHNLGVRGKRGNIVQTYPGTEYNFVPDTLIVQRGDFIHFQWTGSNTNPGNNAGQGAQGTDRSNIILLRSNVPGYNTIAPSPGQIGDWKQSYPTRIDDNSASGNFLGLTLEPKRALARAGIYTPHIDIGPLQVHDVGVYNYLSTRNNNFSNRDQKGEIRVIERTDPASYRRIDTFGIFSKQISSSGNAWLRYFPDPLGFTTGSQITIEEDGEDVVVIRPFFFDVVPEQKIFLEMKYTERGLTNYYIMQSFDRGFGEEYELPTDYEGGVASSAINRGGYYRLDKRPAVGAIVGIVVGIAAFLALAGAVYWKIKTKFKFAGKKPHLMSEGETTTSTAA